jgi:hypothetical protein
MTDAPVQPKDTVPHADDVLRIIELIEGGESERSACATVGMNRATFRSRALKLGAADHYARAIEGLARDQVEQIEAAIEKLEAGTFDHQTMRAVVDARKWIASKLFPRQWGDKTQIVGGDPAAGDKPIQVVDVTGLTPEQLTVLASVRVAGE